MLLGKRPRPPMKRTTSMTGIITTVDFHDHHHQSPQPMSNPTEEAVVGGVADYDHHHHHRIPQYHNNQEYYNSNQYFMSMLSPRPNTTARGQRSNSDDFLQTAHFLRTCGLCNRRLISGRDIYMYMGDTAFCSLECREKQMKKDEKKENCTAKKIGETSSSS